MTNLGKCSTNSIKPLNCLCSMFGRPVHGLSSQHPFRLPIQSFSPLSRSLFELDLHGLHMLLPCHLFSHPFPLL